MTDRQGLLRRTAKIAAEFIDGLPDAAGRPAGRPRRRSARPWTARSRTVPAEPQAVIEALARGADPGLVASAGPRYFGFVIGGGVPAALAADWLASAWDQNAAMYAVSPAASVVEEVAARWLVELFGLPAGSSVGFVTGATMATFTALAAGRHRVLERAGWNIEETGLRWRAADRGRRRGGGPRHDLRVAPDARARADARAQGGGRRAGPDACRRRCARPSPASTGRRSCAPSRAT